MRLASSFEMLIMKYFLIHSNYFRFVETSKAGTTSQKLECLSKNKNLQDMGVHIKSFTFDVEREVEHVNIRINNRCIWRHCLLNALQIWTLLYLHVFSVFYIIVVFLCVLINECIMHQVCFDISIIWLECLLIPGLKTEMRAKYPFSIQLNKANLQFTLCD